MLYTAKDSERVVSEKNEAPFRSEWRRDYARLIHSPAFRRLQGKTQLFPGSESDFFRNRLTHSLEVAQIAKTIAMKLNQDLADQNHDLHIEPDIVEIAGLAHDLGHPPFGHLGEQALDEAMYPYGGFEGNAQTLRILTKLEKKRLSKSQKYGLNLTYRVLASILKYDYPIPQKRTKTKYRGPVKGYYQNELDLVTKIKEHVLIRPTNKSFKTIECQIMDKADDIAYSTYDLEDAFKAGFSSPIEFISASSEIVKKVAEKITKATGEKYTENDVREIVDRMFYRIFNFGAEQINSEIITMELGAAYRLSEKIAKDGYSRAAFTSALVNRFIQNIKIIEIDKNNPSLSKVGFPPEIKEEIEMLKHFNYESQILSSRLKIVEFRGKEIVHTIFSAIADPNGYLLLPDDFRVLYNDTRTKKDRMRVICDFVAGMTDRYALEFYGRLKSENPQTIFKPF